MKVIVFSLAVFLLSSIAIGYGQELTSDELATLEDLNKRYSIDNTASLNENSAFYYAWLLYRMGDKVKFSKADTVLTYGISLQDNDPGSITFGQWGWKWEGGEKVVDFNNALFAAEIMFRKLWDQQNKMSIATQEKFITSCKHLLEAALRRWETEVFDIGRDFVNYSNIFVLYVETFTLAGERFNNYRIKKMAKSQWTRWYNHIFYYGIDEFASPGYNHVILSHLINIYDFCHDERIQREVKEVMDHIYFLQSLLNHPKLKMPITGISRDYRMFIEPGDARSRVLKLAPPKAYTPPAKAIELSKNRTYPFQVIGKAAINPFIFKSYQLSDAGMGSFTGGNCYEQQMHCMTAVGKNENERAVAFLQGTYTHVNGFTDQIETSILCVYNMLPTYWHTTQWRGDMSVYKETTDEFGIGITADWAETLNTPSHIVLKAYGYDLHIFPFKIKDEKIVPNQLILTHRTNTSYSGRYHPRPRIYDEYVFPQEPDWFGAFITLVKSGTKVDKPDIVYTVEDGVRSFKTDTGHQIRLFVTEKNETKQLFNVDPALNPSC